MKQAALASKRISKLPLDVVICSTMHRAKQTHGVVFGGIQTPTEYSDLFIERSRPSSVMGKPLQHPDVLHAYSEISKNFDKPGYRFSDEENFDDLKKRSLSALEYLMNRPEENILVVTHGMFLKILLAHMILGDDVGASECLKFVENIKIDNTGITNVAYNELKPANPWRLIMWNDTAHLE